ncbi:MAG: CHAT domain-containing protein [Saprospiraceae bacterium]|nr:CHAT domain-containing protein [Saprospiraceae bacterium]
MRSVSLTIAILFLILTSLYGSLDTLQLRKQFQQVQQLSQAADCKAAMVMANRLLGEPSTASALPLDIAIGLQLILGDCELEQGNYSEAKGRYDQALQQLNVDPRAQDAPLLSAEITHKIGNYYLETKAYGLAIPLLEKALQARKDTLGLWHPKVADSYVNLGICAQASGDFDQALDYHQQALAIRTDLIPEQLPKLAQCHNNIGLCYDDQQNFEASKRAYRAALAGYQEAFGKQHPKVADVLLNLGNLYGTEGQIDSFILFQNRAKLIWQALYGKNHPLVALSYNNLANAYDQLGQSQKALELFKQALDIQQNIYGPIHPDVAATHFNMGLTFAWQEEWTQAQAAFQQSLAALQFQAGQATAFEQVNNPMLLLRVLQVAAEVPKRQFQRDQKVTYLEQAAEYLSQADKLIDHLRTSYTATASKLALAQSAQAVYSDAVHLSTTIGDLTKNQAHYEQAYYYAEKSKGLLLLEALKKSDAASFTGVPDERLQIIKKVETEIGSLETQLFLLQQRSEEEIKARLDSLNKQIFDKKQSLKVSIQKLEEDYPEYYRLRYETAPPSITWLQAKLLKENESIVEYFLGNRFLYVFVINQDDFHVRSVPIQQDFRTVITNYNNTIRNFPFVPTKELRSNIESYARAAFSLYEHLIAPVDSLLLDRLIIIPDEELGYLSFEALLQELPKNLSLFKEYQYLIRDFTISYNYSTGLLKEMQTHSAVAKLKPYLGFAPTFGPNHSKQLNELKYGQTEIQGTQERLGGEIFAGAMATKANFLNEQSRYRILHLATHGKANDAYGDYSFLAFTENPEVQGDQALLFVREIYNLNTNAELIVLSACETGTGELQQGEGIASIARSFSYAGAKSLVASHWSVDDKATSQLMHRFFDYINEGFTKDEALRAAKLDFIAKGKHKDVHPFYWASFVPIGNMDQIYFQFGNFNYLAIGVLLLLGLIVILLFRKRRFSPTN